MIGGADYKDRFLPVVTSLNYADLSKNACIWAKFCLFLPLSYVYILFDYQSLFYRK